MICVTQESEVRFESGVAVVIYIAAILPNHLCVILLW